MANNNFLPFAPTDTGTNLLSQSDYALATDRTNGNQPGVASSKLNNKAIRQSSYVVSQLAQYISNKLNADVLDDANPAELLAQFYSTFAPNGSLSIENLGFATSVGTNALTFALKTQAGTNPSATDVAYIGERSATVTTGNFTRCAITSALSLTVSSGSTLGMDSGVAGYLYLYALNNAGTIELGVINGMLDEGTLQTSTAEGGTGTADSANVLYSTTARSNVPVRLIGRILISEATAGTWVSNATELSVVPFSSNEVTTFTANFNVGAGVSGSGTSFTVNAIRSGRLVTLTFPRMDTMTAGTTANNFATASGTVPTRFRPVNTLNVLSTSRANGTFATTPAQFQISTDGTLTIFRSLDGSSNFTSSQTNNGAGALSATYQTN